MAFVCDNRPIQHLIGVSFYLWLPLHFNEMAALFLSLFLSTHLLIPKCSGKAVSCTGRCTATPSPHSGRKRSRAENLGMWRAIEDKGIRITLGESEDRHVMLPVMPPDEVNALAARFDAW